MAQHFLRGIDDELYRRMKIQAAKDTLTLKQALLKLIALYAAGKVKLTTSRV